MCVMVMVNGKLERGGRYLKSYSVFQIAGKKNLIFVTSAGKSLGVGYVIRTNIVRVVENQRFNYESH